MIRIFISYSNNDKKIAGKIKKYFEEYDGITCFLAHDDIVPGSQWEDDILKNLKEATFFMPLQTVNLINSFWCQQEAGIAVAKDKDIVPLIPDENGVDPIGFYSKYQGIKINLSDLRGSIKFWLVKKGIIKNRDEDILEKRLILFERSESWADATKNIKALLELEDDFSKSDILRIAEASTENPQIFSSFGARPYIKEFLINAKIV